MYRIYLRKSSTKSTAAFSGLCRCVTCFESRRNSIYACPFCGRYLGCFSCLTKVNKLPLCRKKLSCLKCTGNGPHNPLFIPDFEILIEIPSMRSNALKPPSESGNPDNILITQHSHQVQTVICECWESLSKKWEVCLKQVAFVYERMNSFHKLLCWILLLLVFLTLFSLYLHYFCIF